MVEAILYNWNWGMFSSGLIQCSSRLRQKEVVIPELQQPIMDYMTIAYLIKPEETPSWYIVLPFSLLKYAEQHQHVAVTHNFILKPVTISIFWISK